MAIGQQSVSITVMDAIAIVFVVLGVLILVNPHPLVKIFIWNHIRSSPYEEFVQRGFGRIYLVSIRAVGIGYIIFGAGLLLSLVP